MITVSRLLQQSASAALLMFCFYSSAMSMCPNDLAFANLSAVEEAQPAAVKLGDASTLVKAQPAAVKLGDASTLVKAQPAAMKLGDASALVKGQPATVKLGYASSVAKTCPHFAEINISTLVAEKTLSICQDSKQLVDGTYKLWEERRNGSIVYVASGRDNARIVLDNAPEADGSYLYKYRQQLETLTGVKTGELAYTGRALTQYFNQVNLAADPSYVAGDNSVRTDFTLYGGLGSTNNSYVGEEENPSSLLGVLELQARNERWNRHAAYAQYRFSGANEDDNFDYRSHQLSLGYRFFILDSNFKAFASLKVASITVNTQPVGLFNEEMLVGFEDNTGVNVNAPIAPGLGFGYTWDSWGIQAQWHDIVAAGLDGNGEIGTDFTLGATYTF